MGGRHRKKSEPNVNRAKLVLPGVVVALLPVSIALGYYNLVSQESIQLHAANSYAAAPVVAVPSTTTATETPSPVAAVPTIRVAPDPTPTTTASQRPTERPTESPVTTSTTRPSPSHQATETIKPPTTTEAPPAKISKASSSPKCKGLQSEEAVVTACNALMEVFPDISSMGGRAARPDNPTSCHPHGLGLDVMVSKAVGDKVNAWVHANREKYGIAYIAWQVPDHYDHVHLSFKPCKG